MKTTLRNSELNVAVNFKGAEVCSVKNDKGVEYIWQAKKDVWARHAPILFPIVGKLKDDEFIFEDEPYSLPQHGFARDMDFDLISGEESSCCFRLSSNNETFRKYPFEFDLDVSHSLQRSTLITSYRVKNNSVGAMFFSIGAHPGFNCPLTPGEKFEDYYLEFENSSLQRTLLKEGLISDQKSDLQLKDKKLFLTPELFDQDALVFENSQINRVSLRSSVTSHSISMECKGWPFFGVWTKKGNRNFICLEPWHGIADHVSHDQKLNRKKGIITLPSAGEFKCSFSTSFT
jgi:galactose mutarotase-like enzyme